MSAFFEGDLAAVSISGVSVIARCPQSDSLTVIGFRERLLEYRRGTLGIAGGPHLLKLLVKVSRFHIVVDLEHFYSK